MRKSGIAIVVAATLALAACGSSGPSKSAGTTVLNGRDVLLASVVKTAAADSAKVSLDMSFGGIGNGVSASGEGVLDFASGDSQVTVDIGGALGSLVPSGIEARTVDGVAYVKLPVGLPSGKEWIAVDTKQLGGSGSNTALTIGGGSDPTKILAYLEKVSNGVEEVGTDTVRGVETTHYAAKIDLTKVVEREDVPPALRDALEQTAGEVGDVPVDVWIDGDGLLRREKLEMNFASYLSGDRGATAASGDAPTITMTMDLFDFGTPVNVEAPPPDQVASLPSIGDFGPGKSSANA